MVNAAGRTRRWNRLSKSENNWSRSLGERGGSRRTLWMSGHRGRFRNSSHFRYRLSATKIYRWGDCARTGIDDQLSLSAHGVTTKALSKGAAFSRWKIDNRGDALRRGDRLSWARARNHCQDQGGAFPSEKSVCGCDRRICGFDRCATARDRCCPSKSYCGRAANRGKSQRLKGPQFRLFRPLRKSSSSVKI